MRVCKQCERHLDDSNFRVRKSRARGIYDVVAKPHYNTICKECEALNMRAHTMLKKIEAGQPYDEDALRQLKEYYSSLLESGREPITAAARRLIGMQPLDWPNRPTKADDMMRLVRSTKQLLEHIDKVRCRAYDSFEQADAVHRRLTPQLKEAGLYEEVNNMMDDWYMDEE